MPPRLYDGTELGFRRYGLDRTPDQLDGTRFDLTDPLARNAVLPRQFVQGLRFIGEQARLDDGPLAR